VPVRTGESVREVVRRPDGWGVELANGAELLEADGVVLAVPAPAAARILAEAAPSAVGDLDAYEYASVAIVTLAFPSAAFGPDGPPGSGFLVPPAEGRMIKASTFSSAKWPWLAHSAGNLVVLRASVGRQGEEQDLDRDDADLTKAALADLTEILGLAAAPVDTHVQRWIGGLPQYTVGHLDRVARIRAALPPGIAVAGAAYDGVGIPACVASAEKAVTALMEGFEPR
jgi:oxygen-dependent protoporphyrinogen oxidase